MKKKLAEQKRWTRRSGARPYFEAKPLFAGGPNYRSPAGNFGFHQGGEPGLTPL
jgi:hypothetical protein